MAGSFPKVRNAVKQAFAQIRPPEIQDPAWVAYNKLKPHDFGTLIEKHGEEKVLQYIKDMEHTRSKYAK